MTIKALNPFAPFWWTPPGEMESPNPTRFKIRGLDGNEQGYVMPEIVVDPGARFPRGLSGRGVEIALGYGLLDWENFANDKGPVACVPGNFGLIDHVTRTQLAIQILAASYVLPEEKKT